MFRKILLGVGILVGSGLGYASQHYRGSMPHFMMHHASMPHFMMHHASMPH